MAESDFDVLILGAGSGGYACALRAAQLGLKRRPGREGQARRHLPARRLHPDQGAAARRRGRRQRPRVRAVRRPRHARGHRHGRRQRLQGRRRRAAVQGADRADQGPRHHRHRGRRPADRPARGDRRRHGLHRPSTSCSPPAPTPSTLPGLEIDGERVITSEHALRLDRVPASVDRARRRRDRLRVRQRVASASAPRSPSSRRCPGWSPPRTRRRRRRSSAPSASAGSRSAPARRSRASRPPTTASP